MSSGVRYEFDSPSTGPLRLTQKEWDKLIDKVLVDNLAERVKAKQEAEKARRG